MQLNVYIPKDKEYLLEALVRAAKRSGLSKNEIVLEAIERRVLTEGEPSYQVYDLGAGTIDRASLYEDRVG
jgi:hypothetical protein